MKHSDMKHGDRRIDRRVKPAPRLIDERVRAAREKAIIRYVYGKRG